MRPRVGVGHILGLCTLFVVLSGAALAFCDRPLKLVLPDWGRFSKVSTMPERHSFLYDQQLWTAVLGSINCHVDWSFLPVKRLITSMEQGAVDGTAPSLTAPGRERYAQFSEPYRFVEIVGFVRRQDSERLVVRSAADLRHGDMRIGFPLGGWFGEDIQRVIDDAEALGDRALFSDSGELMFTWLRNSRVDILISPKKLGEAYLTAQGWEENFMAYPTVFDSQRYRLMLRKDVNGLPAMTDINRALAAFLASDAHTVMVRKLAAKSVPH